MASPPSTKKVDIVGEWLLQEDLGSGQFGKVRKAINLETGKKAAIKIIRLARVLNLYKNPETAKKTLVREIQILKMLKHPNIVGLLDIISGEEEIYLVMELVTGGQLSSYLLQKKRLSEEEARKIFRQVVSAIEYCHGNLITHRDLKMENILLDGAGNVKVADFGFSKMIQPGRLFNTFCGSPLYVPPELILRQEYHGPPVDIWALGVLLFTMVSGGLPFWEPKANVQVLLRKVLAGKFTLPKHLSPDCCDLITRMLQGDPRQRITIDEIRTHPWVIKCFNTAPDSYLPSVPMVPPKDEEDLDTEIVGKLELMGFKTEEVTRSVVQSEHRQATFIYHLLLARKNQTTPPLSPLSPRKDTGSVQKDFEQAEEAAGRVRLRASSFPDVFDVPPAIFSESSSSPPPSPPPQTNVPVSSLSASNLIQRTLNLSPKLRRLVSKQGESSPGSVSPAR